MKKFLGIALMPLPICLLLLIAGAGLMFRPKWARVGRALLFSGVGLLLFFSNNAISSWLVRPLESRFAAIPELRRGAPIPPELLACRYVVVLGSGNGNTPGRAALDELSNSAVARISEAVRLLHTLPAARLMVSGSPDADHASHATVLARTAISLGIDEQRIVLIESARDTEDESLAVRDRVGHEPFALVTSAWHMPRAMALFRHAGLSPVACPTDFSAHDDGEWHWINLGFDLPSLERSTWAVRERLGYAWIWLRGKG